MTTRILEQRKSERPSNLQLPAADVLITAATWDIRCLAIAEATPPADRFATLLLDYPDRGESGKFDEHTRRLYQHFERAGAGNVTRLPVIPANLAATWVAVRAQLLSWYSSLGRPLRVIVDLNSVPRYVTLSILGFGARTGIISALVASYAAASGYASGPDGREIAFTAGTWFPMAVPTLGEGASPSSRSLLVVTAGFEGLGTRRLVNALEPDRLALAITSGINVEFERTARRANVGLTEDFLLEQGHVIWLPSDDVESSVKSLKAGIHPMTRSKDGNFAVSFLLCGTKLSALAAGIYSLENPVAQVYYARPERWVESSAEGIDWFTTIEIRL